MKTISALLLTLSVLTSDLAFAKKNVEYYSQSASTMINDIPDTIVVACGGEIPEVTFWPAEDCQQSFISYEDSELMESGCAGHLIRTYTIAIDTLESFQIEQVVLFIDTIPPTLHNLPQDITLGCNEPIPNPADVSATDQCDIDLELVMTEEILEGDCPSSYTIIRNFMANDDCGNSVSFAQSITIGDFEGPVFTEVPPDLAFDCFSDIPAADVSQISAIDNCGEVTIIWAGDTWEGSDCVGTIFRTYSATDECGNWVSFVQMIEYGSALEFINVPEDICVVDPEDIPSAAEVEVESLCGSTEVQFNEITNGNPEDECFSLTRIWTAVDDCGNEIEHVQNITSNDTEAPILNDIPDDTEVSCEYVPLPATVTASDNCDSLVEVVFEEDYIPGECPSNYILVRSWTATDGCGNFSTASQTIYVVDWEAPIITGMPTCTNNNYLYGFSADDNCGMVTFWVEISDEVPGECPNTTEAMIVYNAQDECGNYSSISGEVIIDSEAPVITSCPADEVHEHFNDIPAPNPSLVQATDNCSEVIYSHWNDEQIGDDCSGVIERTYRAHDGCGNFTECIQTIEYDASASLLTLNAGNDTTICADQDIVELNATALNADEFAWSGGQGVFSNDSTLNTTYIPTPDEIESGLVALILSGSNVCEATASDTIVITLAPLSNVNAGFHQEYCSAADSIVFLSGTVINAQGGTWSGGNGTFLPHPDSLVTTYYPTPDEIESGLITFTLTSTGNEACGAVSDTVEINFIQSPEMFQEVNACDCFQGADGIIYSESGLYSACIPNESGCDSVIFTQLNVLQIDTSVTVSGFSLTSNTENASYQWINCADNSIIEGATEQSFSATENGSYAVIITLDVCGSDTSGCNTLVVDGIIDQNPIVSAIYPNPSSGLFNIELQQAAEVSVTDMTGRTIYHRMFNQQGIQTLDLNGHSAGMYCIQATTGQTSVTARIIILQ